VHLSDEDASSLSYCSLRSSQELFKFKVNQSIRQGCIKRMSLEAIIVYFYCNIFYSFDSRYRYQVLRKMNCPDTGTVLHRTLCLFVFKRCCGAGRFFCGFSSSLSKISALVPGPTIFTVYPVPIPVFPKKANVVHGCKQCCGSKHFFILDPNIFHIPDPT
jgi:hypothetical protein